MSEIPDNRRADGPATYWLRPKTNRILAAVIGGIGIALLAYLIFGPKPWDETLDFSLEAKERLRTHSFAVKGLWIAALINLVLIAVFAAAWRFRPKEMCDLRRKNVTSAGRAIPVRERVILAGLVIAAICTAGVMMWPRLSLSLWGDEEATARRMVVGNIHRLDDDSLVLIKPHWKRTFWSWDNGPNSHMFFNVLSRLSHGPANISPDQPDRFHFDERRIRLPSFLATLVMVAAVAWLTALLGAPRGAPLVAFFLALHPWIIRYGTEARGYGLMMAFASLTICFLLKALRSERPLFWWIAFGLSEAMMLYSHLSSVYYLFPLNLAALWLVWSPFDPGHRNPLRVADVWRLAGANLLGAALSIQLMLPNLLQLPEWLKIDRLRGDPGGFAWLQDWLSFWATGMPWNSWQPKNPNNLTLQETLSAQPVLAFAVIALLALFGLAGLVAFLRRHRQRVWLLPLVLPVPLMFLVAQRSGTLLYPWYAAGFLPAAAVVIGIGFSSLARKLDQVPGRIASFASIALAAALLIPFAFVTDPQRQINRTRSVEPLAESVRMTRKVVNPFHPEIDESLTLGFVHATQLYDSAMIYARTDEQFLEAVQRAEESGKTLWVNAANLNLGRPVFPKTFSLLDNRAVFEEPEILYGLQIPCTRYLFRYKPGGLSNVSRNFPASRSRLLRGVSARSRKHEGPCENPLCLHPLQF